MKELETGPPGIEPRNFLRQEVSSRRLNIEETLKHYYDFCVVNRGMQSRTAKDYREYAVRFLKASKGVVSEESVRGYLAIFLSKKPKTYNNQLEGLRSFIGRSLNRMDIMDRFRRLWQQSSYERILPTRQQIRKGFEALNRDDEKALFLLFATSGIRKSEALKLCEADVDRSLRCVKPKHDTRTKKAGVSFYNEECAAYLAKLETGSPRIFHMKTDRFDSIWHRVSKEAGVKITPQVLRVWQSTELGERGVPDRYVDVFQGRAPKSMIARFYTGKELLRLKRIYGKAGLKILD
jgi:intergrase/recombinase